MVKFRNNRISRRTVDAIAVERDTVSRDSELRGSGFGSMPRDGRSASFRPGLAARRVAGAMTPTRCKSLGISERRSM